MKLHILIPVLFCGLIAAGCGNKPVTTEPTPAVEETAKPGETDFPTFWTAFRGAVVERKIDDIKKHTQFPLQTKSEMDGDPIINYLENEFDEMFLLFLQNPTGLNPSNFDETQQQYIEANKTITFNENKLPMMEDSLTAKITSMEFKKSSGGWKLVSLYLDEDIYTKTGKRALSSK